MTTDVYNNNQQKTVPAPLWRLQCPSGYLCPSRVDDEQGEKKQEMKRQGDKNFQKKKKEPERKLCVGTWRVGREEKKRSFDGEFWLRVR
jgi:hypothetical protein